MKDIKLKAGQKVRDEKGRLFEIEEGDQLHMKEGNQWDSIVENLRDDINNGEIMKVIARSRKTSFEIFKPIVDASERDNFYFTDKQENSFLVFYFNDIQVAGMDEGDYYFNMIGDLLIRVIPHRR